MTFEEGSRTSRLIQRGMSVRTGPVVILGLIVAMVLVSVGMSALIEAIFGTNRADNLGQTGQLFESVGAVFSGLAFIALVTTFLLQLEELRLQRQELENQRYEMSRTQEELHRSAEADLRTLHMELLKMAINDDELGRVWPDPDPATVPHSTRRQLWYANLVYQHSRLALELGNSGIEPTREMVRNLFRSPIIRDYWQSGAQVRATTLTPGTTEWDFAQMADEIFGEMPDPPERDLRIVD
ncbi:MAG TPA: DUF6082 family protein [Actinocrinis sp.]